MSSHQPVVLSADDDEDARFLLERAFVRAGVNAVLKQVRDGMQAIHYLQGEGVYSDRTLFPLPDLLLLDLKMPQASGFDVLKFIQGHTASRKNFKTVVFTASPHEKDIEHARALGSDAYLVKPTDFKSLVVMVSSIETTFLKGGQPARHHELQAPVPAPSRSYIPVLQPNAGQAKTIMKPTQSFSESPDMFRLLVQQVKDYAIFLLDTEGHIRSWNEGARRIKGYEADEIIGRHFAIFYPQSDIDSEKPTFELRKAVQLGRYEEEGWRVRKDGSRFWANVILTPLRLSDGSLTGFAKITRDLTQRKFQEEHLQTLLESEERFRLLVDQVKDYAIFFLDAKGNISSWNQGARRIKGYTSDEIIGRHFSTFYIPEDLADGKPERELTIAIREGRYEEEGWRLRKDGSRFWASVVITSLWDKRGNLTGFAKVTRDLTARKKEQEALIAKTQELEALAHTLSHDLRAPIRSIASFAEILEEDIAKMSASEQKDHLSKIRKAAHMMEGMIQGILKMSEVSLASLPEESIPLQEIIEEALSFHESDIKKTNAHFDIQKPLPEIHANRTVLLQIFSNLIANALKFVRPGERPIIQIFAHHRQFDCEIHVKDSGPGIPEEYKDKIFNIFERGKADAASSGSGVGLAIVKRAILRAGGSITVESTEGEGSDFVLTLPCDVAAFAEAH